MSRRYFVLIAFFSVLFQACNAFDGVESSKGLDTQGMLVHARSLMSQNQCYQSRDLLLPLTPYNDDVRVALGWSHLCIAGATAQNIALSIYNYSTGSTDLTVIGALARTMLPINANTIVATQAAIDLFRGMNDATRAPLETAIGDFARAAAILAAQANNDGSSTLTQTDISLSGCSSSCTTCTTPGISDGDVAIFTAAISDASTILSNTNAASLNSLATLLNSGVSGAADAARCFIYANTIPTP